MGFVADLIFKNLDIHITFPWGISIVNAMAYPDMTQSDDNYIECVRAIVEDPFFDGVEIPKPPENLWGQIEKLLEERFVILAAQSEVLQKGANMSSLDEAERKKAIESMGKLVEDAGRHDVCLLAFCSGPDPGANKRAEATTKLLDSLKKLCEKAGDNGVSLLLETFDRNHDKKLLIGPVEEAVKVVKEVRKDYYNIGLMWDLSHGPLLGEKPEILKKAGDLIAHIHIGCAKKADKPSALLDHHPGFYTKNSINTVDDVADLMEVLMDIDYCGLVGFEVKPQEPQTSKEVINTAKGVLMEAFQKAVPRILKR
nr:sugar phosphate isomerase/epimerase family protein [Candidatus Njordarchaeota archaeon]